VSSARLLAGSVVHLSGTGFGNSSGASEVIADYGRGFRYALAPVSWNDRSIKVKIPDFGKGLKIRLQIKVNQVTSNPVGVTLVPIIKSAPQVQSNRAHTLSVGDKGEDQFTLVNQSAACNRTGELYHHAQIQFVKKRFADAQFVSLPAQNCSRCRDIRVRWYNEPTGLLYYRLLLFKRRIQGICPQRIRH